MPKFRVYATNKQYLEGIIEAPTLEEAQRIADHELIVDDFEVVTCTFDMDLNEIEEV